MVAMKRKPMTAGKLMQELSQNASYVERTRSQTAKQSSEQAKVRKELDPVINELNNAGFKIRNTTQLRTSVITFGERVAPILIKWLPKIRNSHSKEILVRALSVPALKRAAAPILIDEFNRSNGQSGMLCQLLRMTPSLSR